MLPQPGSSDGHKPTDQGRPSCLKRQVRPTAQKPLHLTKDSPAARSHPRSRDFPPVSTNPPAFGAQLHVTALTLLGRYSMKTYKPDHRPDRPQPTPWAAYREWLLPRWQSILGSNPPEQVVQTFLEAHPSLLPGGLGDVGPGGHHGPVLDGVFREPPLEGLARDRRPDFMWITRSTDLITPVCIEIEKPGKNWFTQRERPTAELTQALDQLVDWKVWFAEPENQSIFRKTYLLSGYEDRRLLPQYVLIFGRSSEFERSGQHKRPDRLRKKRDFMRRADEQFMTFDSLRPKEEYSDFVTLSMTADGPTLHAIPPSFTTGPPTMGIAGMIRDPRDAIYRTEMWDDTRKAYVLERWLHWQRIADMPEELAASSVQLGE